MADQVKRAQRRLTNAKRAHETAAKRSHAARAEVQAAARAELLAATAEREAQDALAEAYLESALPWRPIRESNDWGVYYLEFDEGHATASERRSIVPRGETFQLRSTHDGEILTVRWVAIQTTDSVSDHGHRDLVTSTRIMMLGDGPRPAPVVGWVLPDEWKPGRPA